MSTCDRSLIDIVKEIEMPYARIEYDARIEEGKILLKITL